MQYAKYINNKANKNTLESYPNTVHTLDTCAMCTHENGCIDQKQVPKNVALDRRDYMSLIINAMLSHTSSSSKIMKKKGHRT